MRRHPLTILPCFVASLLLGDPGSRVARAKDSAKPKWYSTVKLDDTYVDRKVSIPVDADRALQLLGAVRGRVPASWRDRLPEEPRPAKRAGRLPDDELVRRVDEPQSLRVHILGFDENRVRVALARHVANYLWHWYYAVEADLTIERSPEVDARLDMAKFTAPFTRTIEGIGHGSTPAEVHRKLGRPAWSRNTQAVGYSWDYYPSRGTTIHYQHNVFQILEGTPQRTTSVLPPKLREQNRETNERNRRLLQQHQQRMRARRQKELEEDSFTPVEQTEIPRRPGKK